MNAAAVQFCNALARLAAIVVALIGSLSLLRWILDLRALKAMFTGGVTIKTNASICLMLLASALLLLRKEVGRGKWRTWSGRALASIAAAVGALTLTQHLTGHDFGIDQLLFHEPPGALATMSPNRMGPPASMSCMLSGLALLLLDVTTKRERAPAQWLGLIVGMIALLPIIGYA